MKLFSNGYFELNYSASADVLSLSLPDMVTSGLSEAENCFNIMLDHVKNYHVSNLLLDSSNANVDVEDEAYHNLIFNVSMKLKETRLQKVARVSCTIEDLEKNAVKVQERVLKTPPKSYLIKNFCDKDAAMKWLTERN